MAGTLSCLGSSMLIVHCIDKIRKGKNATYHRILLGMSTMDMIASFFGATLTTVLVPREAGGWGNVGTWSTCTFQGFTWQLAGIVPLYNASLAIYFWLAIGIGRRRQSNSTDSNCCCQKRSGRDIIHAVEPILHLIPWTAGLVTGLYGVIKNWYAPLHLYETGCWYSRYPYDCAYNDDVECTHGVPTNEMQNALLIYFAMLPYFLAASVVILANIAVFRTVYKQNQELLEYHVANVQRVAKQNKAVAMQNLLYCFIMINTVLWVSLVDIAMFFPGSISENVIYFLLVMFSLTYPTQGVGNLFIYLKPRYMNIRHDQPDLTWWRAMYRALFQFSDSTSVVDSMRTPAVGNIMSLGNYFPSRMSSVFGRHTSGFFSRNRSQDNDICRDDHSVECLGHLSAGIKELPQCSESNSGSVKWKDLEQPKSPPDNDQEAGSTMSKYIADLEKGEVAT